MRYRGWDGWMASPTWWTWIWVNSRSWWWTGRPGVLQFMGSQRVGHNWVTELNWSDLNLKLTWCCKSIILQFFKKSSQQSVRNGDYSKETQCLKKQQKWFARCFFSFLDYEFVQMFLWPHINQENLSWLLERRLALWDLDYEFFCFFYLNPC